MFLFPKSNWHTGTLYSDSTRVLSFTLLFLVSNLAFRMVSMLFADSFKILKQINNLDALKLKSFEKIIQTCFVCFRVYDICGLQCLILLILLQNFVKHVYVRRKVRIGTIPALSLRKVGILL